LISKTLQLQRTLSKERVLLLLLLFEILFNNEDSPRKEEVLLFLSFQEKKVLF